MVQYDFSTLNSSDLEELVCDLLNADNIRKGIRYKTFKDGKDKGIDILHATDQHPFDHIGQVKHFYRTGYNGLLSTLKKDEVSKIQILKPNKFIVATSVDLTVSQTEKIINLFVPYLKAANDVYGKKDLNRLIATHPKVLDSHYKLWFSNSNVLSKLLNSGLEFRSVAFVDTELKKRVRFYIKTQTFDDARELLKKNKFVIITGEPGVGKTMLAEMLSYEYILKDYKMTYILDNIKEAESALLNDDSKQIIYFDDFLGSNAVEINQAKGSETSLIKILKRIKNTENKYLVFTTRSFLLNTAITESENLKRFNIKAKESILNLSEYDIHMKKAMLKFHVEDSELDQELKEKFENEDLISFIVKHPNFSPRSVEFITSAENVGHIFSEDFIKFIYDNFNAPDEIWKHAYSVQITEDDRILLNTLLSFGNSTSFKNLERAFNKRFDFEVKFNNKQRTIHAFLNAYNRLLGGFIIDKGNQVKFINPSLIDFLLAHLKKDITEVKSIAESASFILQLTTRLYNVNSVEVKNKISKNLENNILNNYMDYVDLKNKDLDMLRLAMLIYKYSKDDRRDQVIVKILLEIEHWYCLNEDYSLKSYFLNFLNRTRNLPSINDHLQDKLMEIFTVLIVGEHNIDLAIDLISDLALSYNMDFEYEDTDYIDSHFTSLLSDHIAEEIEWLVDHITSYDEVREKISEIEEIIDRLEKNGMKIETDIKDFNDYDWDKIALKNDYRRAMRKND